MNASILFSCNRERSTGRAILAASVASLVWSLTGASSFAGAVVFSGTAVTETFDTFGPTGQDTTLLTGAGSFPNNGSSPWTVGVPASGTGNTAALATGTALDAVSDGSVAVTSTPPAMRLFNNGQAGINPDTDRALGSGATGADPIFDLAIMNSSGNSLASISVAYDTEWWRGGNSAAGNSGYLLYYSATGVAGSWTDTGAVQPQKAYASQLDLDGNEPANRETTTVSFSLATPIADSATFFLRWRDTNDVPSPDANTAIDNVVFNAVAVPPPGKNLVYNLAHTAGGAPNGNLDLSGQNYFLEGANPAAFANNDIVNFSQNGTATINVPVDVAPNATNVSATTGTYTIGGAGKISGPLTKSEAGNLVLTSANNFSSATITGGTVETQASAALGTGGVSISGGSLWKVTTAAQTQNSALTVGDGGATIQTDTDLTASVINGTGALAKTGGGTLFLTSEPGTGAGGLDILAGKVSTAAPGGLGNSQPVTLHGTTIEFTNVGAYRTFSDGGRLRTINVGTEGGTIAVTAPGAPEPGLSGINVGNADSITGSGTITKTGAGVVRMLGEHAGLTSNWVINGGTLEYGVVGVGTPLASAIGSGSVTVNADGRIVVAGATGPAVNTVGNNITLNGGALGVRNSDFNEYSGAVDVAANSTVELANFAAPAATIAPLSVSISGVMSGAGNLAVNGIAGATSASTRALVLTNNANTYSGTISVGAGAGLAGTGNTRGAVDVAALGTLGAGASRDAASTSFGTGILSIGGNLTLAPESVFSADLSGGDAAPVAGANYDRVAVGTGPGVTSTGQISLGGSRLSLTLGTGIETGDLFFIMTNDGTDAIVGEFADFTDGQEFTISTAGVGDQIFRISYNGDEATNSFDAANGNDIALIAVPEPGSAAFLALGSALLLRRRRAS